MALSESVEQSLDEAMPSLKNALSYSARNEEPYVSVGIARVIETIDMIKKADKVQDKLTDWLGGGGRSGY